MSTLHELPHTIVGCGADITALCGRQDEIRAAVARHGAVLLRDFRVTGVDDFERVVEGISGHTLTYHERSSPRTAIKGNVYTSTEYPPSEEIFLHNENSYQQKWPMALYFYCVDPPATGGATPLAGTRDVLTRIDPAVREEFTRRGWMVVRNFREGFGVSWQDAFGTGDRAVVAEYCAQSGIEITWTGNDSLRTRAVRPAVHLHPRTGERVWFNHATFWHVSTLSPDVRDGLRAMFAEDELPSQTFFGDGGSIPDATVEHLRDCYRAASTRFDYRRGDIVMIDNMLVAHGRESFTGARRIAVAMAEIHDSRALVVTRPVP
ncbi:TauD/TfdA family dioxygenase [Micromonospora marina]|uniref:Taurine dioxygenase, alpha-ketoglutarate-dependent n=1 Tax=Micromonospora marina TaxID=307120 RepID=A0A1C5AIR0_9ACTN|nr:TauD/TfdA family dioxygenase [Micromonospora marina]SCF45049.1 Taurine dioxygenase, alpha-ketoglutarate-dependent [Micromonospora marina]